jgi:aryl-alcohol dehydrogenase-like predicted oxidoreductase
VLGDALVSVQNQFSPASRSSLPEIEVCGELGLAFLPWSPLGGAPSGRPRSRNSAAAAELVLTDEELARLDGS